MSSGTMKSDGGQETMRKEPEQGSQRRTSKQRAIAASLPRGHPFLSIVLGLGTTSDRQLSVRCKYREERTTQDATCVPSLSLAVLLGLDALHERDVSTFVNNLKPC